jgi:hypothetical protein
VSVVHTILVVYSVVAFVYFAIINTAYLGATALSWRPITAAARGPTSGSNARGTTGWGGAAAARVRRRGAPKVP